MHDRHGVGARRPAFRRHFVVSAGGHLAWEILQLPLYTIWANGTAGEIAFAVMHCTAGDLLIALASLAGALILARASARPSERFREVALLVAPQGRIPTRPGGPGEVVEERRRPVRHQLRPTLLTAFAA